MSETYQELLKRKLHQLERNPRNPNHEPLEIIIFNSFLLGFNGWKYRVSVHQELNPLNVSFFFIFANCKSRCLSHKKPHVLIQHSAQTHAALDWPSRVLNEFLKKCWTKHTVPAYNFVCLKPRRLTLCIFNDKKCLINVKS